MNPLDASVVALGIEAAKLVAMAIEHVVESTTMNDDQKIKALADMRAELNQDNADVQALPVRDTTSAS